MMAFLAINSIRSALNAIERSDYINFPVSIITRWKLKNLELLVLCARKLGNDAQLLRFDDGKVSTLGSLFQRIIGALSRNPPPYHHYGKIMNLDCAIGKFRGEIGGWYNTLLVSLLPQPSFDEVTEIIDSLLELLHLLFTKHALMDWRSMQPIEDLIEKITFLRNFIRFASLRSVVPPQLLAHIHAVAVDAAHTSYIYSFRHEYGVVPNIPVLLHDETYTQALTSSKLSTHLLSPIPHKNHDPSVIMKDFIDSLLSNLRERLHMDNPIVISTNVEELQLVYEGLRWLRIMLKEQPNKFDKGIGELTRVVTCDAGILIFSLCQRDMELDIPASGLLQRINRITQIVKGKDFSIPDLLQRISRIRQRVEGKYLSIPDFLLRFHGAREQVGGNELPRTNELDFIDFVLENLLETSSKACYGLQSQFRMIHDELSSLRNSLGKIEGLRNEQKDLEDLWNAGVKVPYRVEVLIDQLVFGGFQDSSSTSFDSTVEDILKEVKSINSKIHPAPDIKPKKVSTAPRPVLSQNRAPVADEIVGFDDDIESIIDRLTRGSKQLKVVAIVGMPGIGKTTLATKVFNHPSVSFHFHVHLCCCVSQLFHKKNLLLELLKPLDPDTSIAMSEQDLTVKLWRHLKGKRYLIFLDDVWDIEAWDSLKASFPDDYCGSRILVTSRHRDAVLPDEAPHFLRLLTEDESWELLRKKLPLRNEWSLELDELEKQIAANCKGLPLTVVVVAGLLANTEPKDWKIFLESIRSVSGANHCMDTLELSYKHLPGHLKQCFLYFGLFPEDHEVSVKRLIRLWIAEGFVGKKESKSLEDVARDYMMDLVGRSLVVASKTRSRGGVKTCRIHDLLHDFCRRTKAKEEIFFQLIKGYDESVYMRRCLHSEQQQQQQLSLNPTMRWLHRMISIVVSQSRLSTMRCLHSLLFVGHGERQSRGDNIWQRSRGDNISFIIPRCRRLRVLDISQCSLLGSISGIFNDIGFMLLLKYLSVTSVYIGSSSFIPSSIGNLANLETFILHSTGAGSSVPLPDTFWNLQKLRHVDIKHSFRVAFENHEKFPELCELQSCSTVIIRDGESIERLVRKFPNIRKLRCELDWEDSNEVEILIPDSLRQLESLVLMSLDRLHLDSKSAFDLPGNLRKLSLNHFLLHRSDVSMLGNLPNLEVLKFCRVDFQGSTWDMVQGEFSTLRFLELTNSKIVRWTASDDQFPCLEKLVFMFCRRLEEIPYCFESIDTLEMVEICYCCDTVNNFFKEIQEEQRELGNSLPKIQIS